MTNDQFGSFFGTTDLHIYFTVCVYKTSFTPPLFIEVPEQDKGNERSGICVLGSSN